MLISFKFIFIDYIPIFMLKIEIFLVLNILIVFYLSKKLKKERFS